MLPTGIFLWSSGFEGLVSSTNMALLGDCHPLWASGLREFEPWKSYSDNENCLGPLLKSTTRSDSTIVVTGPCSTTMEVARYLVKKGVLGEWGTVISSQQSSGRGQLRRPWVSLPGNLHASIVMPAPPTQGDWSDHLQELLPLVAGFVFGEVLGDLGASLEIKWPNDLLQDGRKVGGMLIEEQNGVVILGLGLNLAESPPDEMMREGYSVSATRLKILPPANTPLTLLELLVNRGKSVYSVLLDELVPTQFISAAASRLAWLGQNVLVREGGQSSYEAEVTGLSPKGGLVLRRSGKEMVLYSGSIFPL